MKNRQEIEQLTEATLNSIDNMQPVDANDFLFAKIKSRMQLNEQRERLNYNRLLVKLSVAMGLFICLNGLSFYILQHQQPKITKTVTSGTAAIAAEYSLTENSYNY
jgi:hypothetical protein